MSRSHIWKILILAAMLISLAGCSGAEEPTQPPAEDPALSVTQFTLAVSEPGQLAQLAEYPNLREVDLRGSSCHEAVLAYVREHPEICVHYEVPIGEKLFEENTEEVILEDGGYVYDQLLEHLVYFPEVTSLSLPRTTLSMSELEGLRNAYPEIQIEYTVMIGDEEIAGDVEELDLSGLLPERVPAVTDALSKLRNLREINLMDGEGKSTLSVTDVKMIMEAVPETTVNYSFELFGKTLHTTDERVEFVGTRIGDSGVDQVRQVLDILPYCTYFLMDRCGVSNEVMAQLRDD